LRALAILPLVVGVATGCPSGTFGVAAAADRVAGAIGAELLAGWMAEAFIAGFNASWRGVPALGGAGGAGACCPPWSAPETKETHTQQSVD